ncbi:neprosin family prolyl endopeptidase [Pigmentibacter sp. JX0631]|uniref:neprosin family prolyl endopeptidase n=1 Tax=Pigmentibacter sp. JX0631 TaxID=2976982 RepID=UPI002468B42E|nr:neprosin family prolyl endopeptidase [Pigmentibacter sp. JX0631]WGL60479.1 neprosin family prolyl endopeptidase [Pigmentibacter sp. JX0631]
MQKKFNTLIITCNILFFIPAFADPIEYEVLDNPIDIEANILNFSKEITANQNLSSKVIERRQKTISYYNRVHILKTFKTSDFTVDCIPFIEQPSLIDNPELGQKLLIDFNNVNSQNALKKFGHLLAFNAAEQCPENSVGIIRPTDAVVNSESVLKTALTESNLFQFNTAADNTAGYSWQVGVTPENKIIYLNQDHGEAYFKGPQLQAVASDNQDDHSLDQFWLLYTAENKVRYSVEFGILASKYFTKLPATSIFIYASIDNYSDKSCYNMGCTGFIQFPSTPVLGVPLTNKSADYVFKVKHVKNNQEQSGFYLTLEAKEPSVSLFNKHSVILGFYPENIYPKGMLPNTFSAGAEVYATAPENGTILYGNYVWPVDGYFRKKKIGMFSQNNNIFPSYSRHELIPFGLVWKFGQKE